MQQFLTELPALIISVLLIVMITLLLITRVLPASDPLIDTLATALISFWLLKGAFAWQPSVPPGTSRPESEPKPPVQP